MRYPFVMNKSEFDKDERQKIALWIREAILSLGRGGQRIISDSCGVSPQAITGWMQKGVISKSNLDILCRITGFSAHWIIFNRGDKLNKTINTKSQNKPENTYSSCVIDATIQSKLGGTIDPSMLPSTLSKIYGLENPDILVAVHTLINLNKKPPSARLQDIDEVIQLLEASKAALTIEQEPKNKKV